MRKVMIAAMLFVSGTLLFAQDEGAPKPKMKTVRTVVVDARFICGSADELAQAGVKVDEPSSTISTEARGKLLEAVQQSRYMTILNAPKMTLISGQRGYVVIGQPQGGHVRDMNYFVDAEHPEMEDDRPLGEGFIFDLRCSVNEKGEIAFSHLNPRTATVLGTRTCSGKIRKGGKAEKVEWKEDVICLGGPGFENPCDFRVKPGEVLVVPLKHHVKQDASPLRAEIIDGKVKEKYERSDGAPGGGRVVCILSAREGERMDAPEDEPIRDFKPPKFEVQEDSEQE